MTALIYAILVVIILLLLWLLIRSSGSRTSSKQQLQQLVQEFQTTAPESSETKEQETEKNENTTESVTSIDEDTIDSEIIRDLASFRLVTREEVSPQQLEFITKKSKNMPRPNPILAPLTKGISDTQELILLVQGDAEIAAQVLRTVNSAAFYLNKEITSIHHAVIYLGINIVKNIALHIALRGTLKAETADQAEAYKNIWSTSYLASAISEKVATAVGISNPGGLSTQSLLFSIGDLGIISFFPEAAKFHNEHLGLFERTKKEQDIFHVNSAIVGKILAEQWELPNSIINCIENCLTPMITPPERIDLGKMVIQPVVFCYAINRICDLIVYDNIRDIGEVNFKKLAPHESYFLKNYLNMVHLNKLDMLLKDAKLRNSINNIIKQILPEDADLNRQSKTS